MTISKQVTGTAANKIKPFTFNVFFTDSSDAPLPANTTFVYEGGVINGMGASAPLDGTLTLDSGGKATFTLTHGQTITIKAIPSDVKIKITESAAGYYTSFKDSADTSNTIWYNMDLTTVGDKARIFAFTNERAEVVPTGIAGGYWGVEIWLLTVALIILSGVAATVFIRHKIRRSRGK